MKCESFWLGYLEGEICVGSRKEGCTENEKSKRSTILEGNITIVLNGFSFQHVNTLFS